MMLGDSLMPFAFGAYNANLPAEDRLRYELEGEFSRVILDRSRVRYRAEFSSYNMGSSQVCNIHVGGQAFVDPQTSYLQCKIRVPMPLYSGVVVAGDEANCQESSTLIRRLRILGNGGVVMEDIDWYSVVSHDLNKQILPAQYRQNAGLFEGTTNQNNVGGALLTTHTNFVNAVTNATSGTVDLNLNIPLRYSGFFSSAKFIPMKEPLTIEITFEDAGNFFYSKSVKTGPGDIDTGATSQVITVLDMEFVSDVVKLTPDMNRALDQAKKSSDGLVMPINTYFTHMQILNAQTLSANVSQRYNVFVPKVAGNVISAFALIHKEERTNTSGWRSSGNTVDPSVWAENNYKKEIWSSSANWKYQWRIGSELIPERETQNEYENYFNLRLSLNRLFDPQFHGIWTPENYRIGGGILGESFLKIPGEVMSGRNVNQDSPLSLRMEQLLKAPQPAADEPGESDKKIRLFVVLYFTRVVSFMEDGAVLVRE